MSQSHEAAGAGPSTPRRPVEGGTPPVVRNATAVLIVDDDPQVAKVLRRLLTREGYRCTLAENAAVARGRLAESHFDIALVDGKMPGESGLELVKEIVPKYVDLAVVMVTGIEDRHIAEFEAQRGAYGHVMKPVWASQLLSTVANAGRRRAIDERPDRILDHLVDVTDAHQARSRTV